MARKQHTEDEGNVAVAEAKLATDLLSHLRDTGTNPIKLKPFETWAREQGEEYTAEQLYRHMEHEGVTQGTLRKAGRYIFGPTFEPESVVSQAPADEIMRLRQENERLKTRNQELVSERNGYMNRARYLEERLEEKTQELAFHKMGKPGIGTNVG